MAIKIILLLLFPLAAVLVPETAAAMSAAMRKPDAGAGNMHKMFFRHRVFPPYLGGGPKGLIPGGGLGGGSSSSSGGGAGAGSGEPGSAGKFFRGIRAAGEASRALNRVYNGGVAAAGM
ncbi:glycine-rich protein 5-like [Ipomoea triloba]|uniref:glycine-rich protein 5-like n=1 Tax=Ipomoea triloba TaxID=35885 RepID=UPI00125D5FF2|nr:glycine-rich protein 5-like [Ipomoea triloba]XP_031125476.1 glycine-rich protein 5-like [Ipomoea triloba]